MANSDKSLRILIETIADLQGVKLTTKEIDSLAEKVKQSNVATNEGTVAAESFAKATTAVAQEASQASTKVEALNFKKSELKKLAGDLTKAFPALGHAMRMALDPRIIGLTLLIKSFQSLNGFIRDTLNLLTPSEWQGRAAAITAGRDAFEDAAIAANQFWHEVSRGVSEVDSLTKKTNSQIEAIHQQSAAEASLRDAAEELALTRINAREKSKELTPEQAAKARSDTKLKFASQRDDAATLEENRVLNEILQARVKLLDKLSELERGVLEKQTAAATAASENAKIARERSIYTDNIASSNAKIAQYEQELEQREKTGMRSATFDNLTDKGVRDSMASEKAARDKANALLDKLNAERVERESKNAGIISDAAAAESELASGRKRLGGLNEEADAGFDTYQRRLKTRNTLGAYRRANEDGSESAGTLLDAGVGANALAAGAKKLPPEQAKAIAEATRIFGLQSQSNQTIITLLSKMTASDESFAKALEQIKRRQVSNSNPLGT